MCSSRFVDPPTAAWTIIALWTASSVRTSRIARRACCCATTARAELRALLAGDKFDRTKAQAFVSQKTEAIQSKSPQVVAALGDFYDSLNPQQQAKVREFMDKRRGWHRS